MRMANATYRPRYGSRRRHCVRNPARRRARAAASRRDRVRMAPPIVYDVTRLGSRVFSASPNGVHRVDATLARHVLTLTDRPVSAAWYPRPLSHRIVSREAGLEVLEGVEGHFDENDDGRLEPLYRDIRGWLLGGGDAGLGAVAARPCSRQAARQGARLARAPWDRPVGRRRDAEGRALSQREPLRARRSRRVRLAGGPSRRQGGVLPA